MFETFKTNIAQETCKKKLVKEQKFIQFSSQLISAQKDFGFLVPDPQKYGDQRIWIQEIKYQPKIAKNLF